MGGTIPKQVVLSCIRKLGVRGSPALSSSIIGCTLKTEINPFLPNVCSGQCFIIETRNQTRANDLILSNNRAAHQSLEGSNRWSGSSSRVSEVFFFFFWGGVVECVCGWEMKLVMA